MEKAVFLDRDGVIIRDGEFITDQSHLHILPGAPQAIRALNNSGMKVVIVTNQPVIARGHLSEAGLDSLHGELRYRLESLAGARIDAIYYCPHHPNADVPEYRQECDCRKPLPGMLLRAARDHDIDIAASYMVGDRVSDVYAGKAAGCRMSIQVLSGEHNDKPIVSGSVTLDELSRTRPDRQVQDLSGAADLILATEGSG